MDRASWCYAHTTLVLLFWGTVDQCVCSCCSAVFAEILLHELADHQCLRHLSTLRSVHWGGTAESCTAATYQLGHVQQLATPKTDDVIQLLPLQLLQDAM